MALLWWLLTEKESAENSHISDYRTSDAETNFCTEGLSYSNQCLQDLDLS